MLRSSLGCLNLLNMEKRFIVTKSKFYFMFIRLFTNTNSIYYSIYLTTSLFTLSASEIFLQPLLKYLWNVGNIGIFSRSDIILLSFRSVGLK